MDKKQEFVLENLNFEIIIFAAKWCCKPPDHLHVGHTRPREGSGSSAGFQWSQLLP
jgi:hypothetical protein